MAAPLARPVTLAEFMAFDDGTDRRYELIRGRIVAMAPPSGTHGALVVRLGGMIDRQLRRPCSVVAEAGIVPAGRDDTYYQADLAVTCDPLRAGRPYLDRPVLVVEVLSPSTEAHDRGQKLPDYRRHPAIQEILLVSTGRKRVERWRRVSKGWLFDEVEEDEALRLDSVEAVIDLATLYDGLELEPPAEGGATPPA